MRQPARPAQARLRTLLAATVGALALLLASAVVASAAASDLSWLAAGDSYSSGEGLPHYTGRCAQAKPGSGSLAWAFVAHEALRSFVPGFATPNFVACSGATTGDFFGKQWHPRMGRFDLITFTFGGNDIGFRNALITCIARPALRRGCPSETALRARIAGFARGYQRFLEAIADRAVVPGGYVVVLGYPELVEDPAVWSRRARLTGCAHFTPSDAREIRGLAGDLNATIAVAVGAVDRERRHNIHFTFIDVNSGGSAGVSRSNRNLFEPAGGVSHNLCSHQPWINPITVIDRGSGSYHPKQAGDNAMGALAAGVIARLDWGSLAHFSGCRTPFHSGSTALGYVTSAKGISCQQAAHEASTQRVFPTGGTAHGYACTSTGVLSAPWSGWIGERCTKDWRVFRLALGGV